VEINFAVCSASGKKSRAKRLNSDEEAENRAEEISLAFLINEIQYLFKSSANWNESVFAKSEKSEVASHPLMDCNLKITSECRNAFSLSGLSLVIKHFNPMQ
jgi:hypothetical protein